MKRWMIFLAIPVAIVLIGILAAKLYFTEERLKALVVPGIESATHRKAEMGGISLSFFPSIGITVEEFRLSNPDRGEFPNPYFLSLTRLFINVRLMPLFSKRVEIDNMVLDGLIVYLDVTSDGRKNYSTDGGAKAAAGAGEGDSTAPMGALLLSNLEIDDGRIEWHNRKLDTRWTVEGLDQTMRIETAPGGTALSISGTSDIQKFSYGSGSSWYLEGVPLTANEQFSYAIPEDRLDFTALTVNLRDVPFKVSGTIDELQQETMMMDLAVESPELTVERLLSLLPAGTMKGGGGVTAEGNVSFSMKIAGPFSDDLNPGVNATFTLSGGTIRYPSLPKSITGVAFDGTLEMPSAPVSKKDIGELEIGRFAATLGTNSFSGKLRISGFGDPVVSASLKGDVALDELGSYYPLEPGTVLAGSVASDVSIDGRTSDPRSMKAGGTMKFRNVTYSTPTMARPVKNLNGDATFNNQVLDLKGIELAVGGSDLRFDATLKNYLSLASSPGEKTAAKPFLTFALKSKVLSTADISTSGDAGGPGTAGGGSGASGTGGPMLPGIDMAGTVDIETLKTEKFTFTNAKGGISMTDGVAALKAMQLDAFGGVIKTDGTLDLRRSDTRPFDLKLDVKGVESNTMLTPFTTFAQYLFGTLSLSTAFKGDLNDTLGITPSTLTGNGSALIADGKLTGVPLLEKLSGYLSTDRLKEVDFDSWSQSFSVADGKLNIKDLKIGGQDVAFTVNGAHGLDGSMDYTMRVQLPKSVSDQVRLQGVADQLLQFFKDGEGRLNLDFFVTGQTTSPALRLDTRPQEAMLKKKLQDEAGKKLSEPLKKAAEGLKKIFKPKP